MLVLSVSLLLSVAACSGGDNSEESGGAGDGSGPGAGAAAGQQAPTTKSEASRFLGQSTFGPQQSGIDALMQTTYETWINEQIALPVSSMRDAFDARQAQNFTEPANRVWLHESFWRHAVTAPDQLRQRVAFALSQIFVISIRDSGVANSPRGTSDFYGMLQRNAFANFRTLLEDVTLHPMMGLYLSHLGNQKSDPATDRVPDENFAREIMQLFTIGLVELNLDGSPQLDGSGQPQETYKTEDVQGLARVMTGFSWNGPDTSLGRFQGWISQADRDVMPMQAYPNHHSTQEKRFLGTVIPASVSADATSDLTVALDALHNHPNVGPFIGRQLIQRLVKSNPSPAYISRVASAFNDNGQGVRGDMESVVRTILLDPEARDMTLVTQPTAGRIREPILRFAHWMRSFNAQSTSGEYRIWNTDDPATSLNMTTLGSPSVFNFYRPGYVPPNTAIADANLVAPEMQITHQTSVAGYLNTMLNTIDLGGGFNFDIKSDYPVAVTLADDIDSLIDHVNLMALHGSMSDSLRSKIVSAVALIPVPASGVQRATALLERAKLASFLAMASPEYIVQK
jgi:uncharacterized protein (DUF1800 family)